MMQIIKDMIKRADELEFIDLIIEHLAWPRWRLRHIEHLRREYPYLFFDYARSWLFPTWIKQRKLYVSLIALNDGRVISQIPPEIWRKVNDYTRPPHVEFQLEDYFCDLRGRCYEYHWSNQKPYDYVEMFIPLEPPLTLPIHPWYSKDEIANVLLSLRPCLLIKDE